MKWAVGWVQFRRISYGESLSYEELCQAQWKLLESVRLQPSLSGPNQSGEKIGSIETEAELSYVFPADRYCNIMRLLPCLANRWTQQYTEHHVINI